ncbi:MAG: glycoside hydrolase family 3 N-terminal domain-containing protein [Candidatus Hodarchaeota archaeon]
MNSKNKDVNPLYLDLNSPIEKRVEDLISRMTVEEKVAQLGSQYPIAVMESNNLSLEKMKKRFRHGIGQISRIGGTLNIPPEECIKIANRIQKFLKQNTRLGIPAIIHEECLSGYCGRGGTNFPQIIGLASTWDPDLVKAMTTKIRAQLRAIGSHQALAPVLDIARDPRWGRTEETFGEDPYLVSQMGTAYVNGLQGESLKDGIIATGKHFVGYGLSQGGRNWGPAFIPKRELLEIFTKPFEAAIKEANLKSIMNAYHEIDGIPCGISRELLTDLLRERWEFTGITVSDYVTIENACILHRVASNPTQAAILAINAGLDVELPRSAGYGNGFIKAIKNGEVSETLIDLSVARILRIKFELGLFENPYIEEGSEKIAKIFSDQEIKDLARKIARKSIVLLKNEDNLLPLKRDLKSIAVIGPNADNVRNLLGDYTFVSQYENSISNATGLREIDKETQLLFNEIFESNNRDSFARRVTGMKSILDAIKEKITKGTRVNYSKGCEILGDDKSGFNEAIEIAKKSEVAILVMGGKSGLTIDCTSGETRDRNKLTLTGVQEDLIRKIHATGAPIILVLINGRPLSISWEKKHIPAILEAWVPGEEGADAVADVLFGDYNPGGKLAISIPRNVGQIPVFHNHKPTGNLSVWTWNYVEDNTTPLFPFGYGLSYTQFEYDSLKINKPQVEINDEVEIALEVKNSGKIRGDEVVQLYLHDRESTITRPVEELFGFKRITLDPGESVKIVFIISIKQLGFYNENMDFVIEPGVIDVYIGSIHSIFNSVQLDLGKDLLSQKDVKLKGKFKIIGETIKLKQKDKKFFTKVIVDKT